MTSPRTLACWRRDATASRHRTQRVNQRPELRRVRAPYQQSQAGTLTLPRCPDKGAAPWSHHSFRNYQTTTDPDDDDRTRGWTKEAHCFRKVWRSVSSCVQYTDSHDVTPSGKKGAWHFSGEHNQVRPNQAVKICFLKIHSRTSHHYIVLCVFVLLFIVHLIPDIYVCVTCM